MTSLLTRALLVLVCGFAALSSSAAAALGLAEERILVFTALLRGAAAAAVRPSAAARPAERAGAAAVRAPGRDRADRPGRHASIRSTPSSPCRSWCCWRRRTSPAT